MAATRTDRPVSRRGDPGGPAVDRAAIPASAPVVPAADPHGTGGSSVAYPEHLRLRVDDYLERLVFSGHGRIAGLAGLEEAMRYSLLAPGKRIRPVLALATAAALGVDCESILPLAGALELIHTYSLMHDDLPAMDDDGLRRGRPTCHVAFGENVAILAGDALYAEAFHHVLIHQAAPADRLLAAVTRLAGATGVAGMVGGQYLDISGQGVAGPDGLRLVHTLKTGELIAASVDCVLLVTGVAEPVRLHYGQFAAELGVLFQIVDDILDVTGTDAALGKPSGSDERHGRRTYVSEHGLSGARELAALSHSNARRALAAAAPDGAAELQQITDFVYTRTS
jgi:geranylgeranyl diphosphate synthase type II